LHETFDPEGEAQSEEYLLLRYHSLKGYCRPPVLSAKKEALLVGRSAFMILDLFLELTDQGHSPDVNRNRLSSKRLHENLIVVVTRIPEQTCIEERR